MFAQGTFNIDQNSTPEQIAEKRALIARLMPQFGRARYVGEGLGQLATGVAIGRANKRLGEVEGQKRAEISGLFDSIMGGARGSAENFNILGQGGAPWTPEPAAPKSPQLPPGMGQTQLGYGQASQFPQPMGDTPLSYSQPQLPEGLEMATPEQMGKGRVMAPEPQFPQPVGAAALGYGARPQYPQPIGEASLGFGNAGQSPQTADAVFRNELLAGGLPAHVVDGILMNAHDESAFNPSAVGDNGAAFGLLQWNGPRKVALQNFAAERGLNPADPKTQAQFTVFELQGPESSAGRALMETSTPGEAAAVFVNQYERPAEEHRRRREAAYLGGASVPQGDRRTAQADTGTRTDAFNAGGFDLGTLAEIANSPYATEGQRAVATQLLEQQMQAADPMYRLGLEREQLEVERLRNGGGTESPAGYRELELRATAAGLVPGTPEFQQFMLSGGGGIREGRPAAFEALHQQALAAGLEEGSDAYKNFMLTKGAGDAARAKEIGTTSGTAAAELAGATAMLGTIDTQINDLLSDPYLPDMLGPIDSRLPNVTSDAARVQGRIDQLSGGAFLQARQMLKGGGAITDFESQRAEQAFARLQTAQRPEDFAQALKEFRAIVAQGVQKLQAQSQMGGQAPASQGGGQVLTFNPETGELE
jgi:hypothetical protein